MRRALAVAALVVASVALGAPSRGVGQAPPGAVRALPVLGVSDLGATLMGAAPQADPPEVWATRVLSTDVPPPRAGDRQLEFGPTAEGAAARGQVVFERWTEATGWLVHSTPVDEDGKATRGPLVNPLGLRVTGRGGVLAVGRVPERRSAEQAVVTVRDPGGEFAYVDAPPSTVVDPTAGEALALDGGSGRVAAAAFETAGRTGAYLGVLGSAREAAVARFDGQAWTREPIDFPQTATSFRILSIAAVTGGGAYLLADDGEPGLDLYRRDDGRWTQVELGDALPEGEALGGAAQPLSVAVGVVWIDGAGPDGQFTVRYDTNREQVTGVFCDAGDACTAPLGFTLSTRTGYRSYAFEGGERTVTNVVRAGLTEAQGAGDFASLAGDEWILQPGGGLPFRPSGAFLAPDKGWLEGMTEITREAPPQKLRRWPVALRAPLNAVAPEPGVPRAAGSSRALAVGADGAVARYVPDQGWLREFLLSSTGAVASPLLRGVAWPEARRAHAVGDLGAMWLWQAETDLWERDPAAPPGFVGNLTGVAFDPADAQRGYAVGREGVLMSYDKSWTQVALPEGYASADFSSIAFAGRQALVAGGSGLLRSDGPGAPFVPDPDVDALLATLPTRPQLVTVAALPDGGAVVAGRNVVLLRDSLTAPWRFADQPLVDATPVTAAAFREEGEVRAVVAVAPRLVYPAIEPLPIVDPDLPQPIVPPYGLPGDGYVLRQTAVGWRDEQRTAYNANATDRPLKSDPTYGLLLDETGQGWAVGGWSGEADSAGRGSSGRGGSAKADRSRVQTAAVQRYTVGVDDLQPPAESAVAPDLGGTGVVRFAVAGHAQCEDRCAAFRDRRIAPDVTLERAIDRVSAISGLPGGPRFMLYTGGRLPAGEGPTGALEGARLGELLTSGDGLAIYPALAAADTEGAGPGPLLGALSGLAAPFGLGAAPRGVTSTSTAPTAESTARTHYAFDSEGDGGAVRVIVIDNSAGSLAASDPHQVPAEPQLPWLQAQLAAAKGRGIPSVVMGSRDLNPRAQPALNVASDGDQVAQALLAGGASAYFFDRPEENRTGAVPAGAAQTVPTFGTGTLGYRSPIANAASTGRPDSRFGDTAYLLAQVKVDERDPQTNRAPVSVRAIPVVDDLTLQPVDGTLLRRSRPSLFQGIGRRPISGDRWGPIAGGTPDPPGGDPYVSFPPASCTTAGCTTRISPEYTFESSSPDIGNFVRQDPASTNLRKPFIDEKDKVVPDATSGLFCPFNAGRTTVTIRAGGLSYSTEVRVLAGSVQRPCGTVPLVGGNIPVLPPVGVPVTPPAPAPASNPPPGSGPPPPPPPPAAPVQPPTPIVKQTPKPAVKPKAPVVVPPPIVPTSFLVPPTPDNLARTPTQPPPPGGGFARPIPPGGATIRVMEEKREEEAAPEQSSAAAAYFPDDHTPIAPYLAGMALIAALAGASLTLGPRRRDRRIEAAYATTARPRRRPPR